VEVWSLLWSRKPLNFEGCGLGEGGSQGEEIRGESGGLWLQPPHIIASMIDAIMSRGTENHAVPGFGERSHVILGYPSPGEGHRICGLPKS
jgi:hypothetical protein